MRSGSERAWSILAGAACVSLLAGCGPRPTPIAHAAWPQRRAGLWEENITQSGRGERQQRMRVCLDASNEMRLSMFGSEEAKTCRRSGTRRPDGAYDFTTACSAAGASLTTHGVASGDFVAGYHVHSTVTVSGSPIGVLNGQRDVDVDARWLGPCPAGMSPGQVVAGGHQKLKISSRIRNLTGALGA
ncbi:MAG TPA: DUF3617 family protein [Caulobacteraceae bacterium]|nr:DUF3617 family protein [Caulobacteraceae bacterium]